MFGSIIMVKEPLAELKFAIFKNWLDTRPKMETHDPNVYPRETDTFGVFTCQKMALRAP